MLESQFDFIAATLFTILAEVSVSSKKEFIAWMLQFIFVALCLMNLYSEHVARSVGVTV